MTLPLTMQQAQAIARENLHGVYRVEMEAAGWYRVTVHGPGGPLYFVRALDDKTAVIGNGQDQWKTKAPPRPRYPSEFELRSCKAKISNGSKRCRYCLTFPPVGSTLYHNAARAAWWCWKCYRDGCEQPREGEHLAAAETKPAPRRDPGGDKLDEAETLRAGDAFNLGREGGNRGD